MADMDPNVDWGYIENLMNQIRRLYPALAWMLNVPELADIILKAGIENWDDGRIMGALQGTQWWKDRNEGARQWEELVNTDPASANQRRDDLARQIKQFAGQNGLQVTNEQAIFIAVESLAKGRTQAEWQQNVLDFTMGTQGQSATAPGMNLKALAAEYAVPLSDVTLKQWEQNILTGMADENTFRAYLVEQAKSLFPSLANALDRGITVRQYVAPYQEIAVQELGVNPADVDWTDPKWSTALHRIDPKTGVAVSMSLSDWQKEIRTNPIYGFDQTVRAKDQATGLGQALMQRLGFAA